MRRSLPCLRTAGAVVALASGAFCVAGLPALADDVTLEGVTLTDKDTTVLFRRIEVKGTNLSKDDVQKLFTKGTPPADSAAIVARMKASSFSIPETQISVKGGTLTARDFLATDIDSGKTGKVVLASIDGSVVGPAEMPTSIHSNAISIEGAEFGGLLAAVKSQDPADMKLRIGHLAWAGFDVSAPDKDTPKDAVGGNLWHVRMASLDARSTYDGDVPLKGAAEMKNLTVEAPRASSAGKSLAQFGYDRLDFGLSFTGAYDPAARTYTVDNYSVSEAKSGTLGLKSNLGSLDSAAFAGAKDIRMASLLNGDLSKASLRFDNNGLFEKSLSFFATAQKMTSDAVRKQWSMAATQFIPFMLGGDPSALKVAEAVTKFIADPKSLTITATAKGSPVKFSEFAAMKNDPTAILGRVQFDAVKAP